MLEVASVITRPTCGGPQCLSQLEIEYNGKFQIKYKEELFFHLQWNVVQLIDWENNEFSHKMKTK